MNSLSFTTPWLLAGLAAVGLPVLIHYLTRARPRRIAFPPYLFLIEACAGRQAVNRLRTFLLLALRCLAVAALVLLFARPFLRPNSPAAEPRAARRVVLIVDGSLSMRAVQQGVPLFARAQAEAADALRALDSGSEAAVIIIGAKPRALLPALSRNLSALHEELVKTQPTYEAGDPAAALSLAAQMLAGHGEVQVFSDFQESNWKSVTELPANITCRMRAVNNGPVENVAITSAQVVPSAPVAGEPAEIVCKVFNSTSRPRQETVRLELAELSQERTVTLAPFGTADAAFTVNLPTPGVFTGKASIPPDDLREDDTRFIAVRAHKTLQLLLISDAEDNDPRSGVFFVSRALVPLPQAAPGLNLVRRHSQDADRGVLETSDVFLIASPATLTGETVDVISRRVNEGAQLIVFLDAPNAGLLMPAAFSPPFTAIQMTEEGAGESLVPGAQKLFPDIDADDWRNIKVRRHYRTQITEGHNDDVLLSHEDGSAALTLTAVGKGAAAFVNIPLTPDGSDLVGSPIFPAVLHELLNRMRRGMEEPSVTPGNSWTLETPTAGESALTVKDPEGKAVDVRVLSSGRATRLALPPVRLPGIYSVSQSGATVAAAAVNVDPSESDMRSIPLEKLQTLPGGANISLAQDEEAQSAGVRNRPLWPQLALAAAAFIALEMLFSALWPSARTVRATTVSAPAPNPMEARP